MDVGAKIRDRRKELELTLEEVGDFVGVTKSTVRKWETGAIENMGRDKIAKLAQVLRVSPIFIMTGRTTDDPVMPRIPLYSQIACGELTFVEEHIIDYISLPYLTGNYFAQKASGDSMIGAGINDGDILVFEHVSTIENGEVGAFCVDGSCTCKRFKRISDKIVLQPENGQYDPILIDEQTSFRVIGKLKRIVKAL